MRFLSAFILLFVALNFSGIPDLFSGLFGDTIICADTTDDCGEKEDSKEKEKEDFKEVLLTESIGLMKYSSVQSLETSNQILLESGCYLEDHSPPPEFI